MPRALEASVRRFRGVTIQAVVAASILGFVFSSVLATAARAASFAYVANIFASTVSVIDAETNVVVISIPVGGAYDLVLDPTGARLYVATIGGGGRIRVVDTTVNAVVDSIPLGANPEDIAIHPDGRTIYVTVSKAAGDELLAVDVATHAIEAAVPVGHDATALAVDPLGRRVYVTEFSSGSIAVMDAATRTLLEPFGGGSLPSALAVHPAGSALYVGDQNGIYVLDPLTGETRGQIPVCCTSSLALNAAGTRMYATTGDVVVVDTAANAVVEPVVLPDPAAELVLDVAVNAPGTRVFATGSDAFDDGPASLWVVDATLNEYLTSVTVGEGANAVVVGPESTCGNGAVEATEQCDDGNDVGGDGCEGTCVRSGISSTTTTSISGATTTTSTLPGACAAIPDCQGAIDGLLPDPSTIANGRSRRVAIRMNRLEQKARASLASAEVRTGKARVRRLAKTERRLAKLLGLARSLHQRDPSLVPLPSLELAVDALLALLRAPA